MHRNAKREATQAPRQRFRIPIPTLAKRGYGMAMTALPIQPPFVCVALLSRKKQSATWLLYRVLYSLLVAASLLTLAPHAQHFTSKYVARGQIRYGTLPLGNSSLLLHCIYVLRRGFCNLVLLIFLRKSDCLGCAVLLCLLVCLPLLASFFLPKHVCM